MAIVAYVGLPGHGKSYSVVEHVILPALKSRRCVVTNVALSRDLIAEAFPGCDLRHFDVDAVLDDPAGIEAAVPAGSVFVVDECWRLWPAGLQGKDVHPAFRSILAEHRHRVDEAGNSMQVVLVTQDLMQLASFARQLVEETYRTVKMVALGSAKRFRVDVYQGAVTGPNPPEKRRINQLFGSYKPEVWRFYQSHTKSKSGGEGANESKVDGRGVLWKGPLFKVGAVVIVVLLGFGVWAITGFFRAERDAAVHVEAGPAPLARGGGRVSSAGVASPWRIVGEVVQGGSATVILASDDGYVMIDAAGYCDKDVSGYLICQWDGRQVSNQVRPLPRAPADRPSTAGVFGLMGSDGQTRGAP